MNSGSPSPRSPRGACSRDDVRFVLVGTTEPGNIGASARALKAAGFSRLVLVRPVDGWRTSHADAMAHGAEDLLDRAQVFDSLDDALRDATWIVGTTRRPRRHQAEAVTPREWGERLAAMPAGERVAILFGAEKTGLLNDEVLRCRLVITIPSPVEYPSLNLSQAVMLLAYESGLALGDPGRRRRRRRLASHEEQERMYAHMEEVLLGSRMNPMKVRSLMRHLRVILGRAELSDQDVSSFHTLAARIRGPKPRVKPEPEKKKPRSRS